MFDELNYFEYEKEDIEEQFRQYFRKMPDITEEQVEERKDVALDVFFLMLFFMGMVKATDEANQYQDLDYYIEMLDRRYIDIVDSRYGNSDYFNEYAPTFARSVVNTTFDNQDDESTLSVSRAVNIAENEANTIVNYEDFQSAIDNGYKYKKWLSEGDNRVRKTHKVVNGKVIPIKDYFKVGLSEMRFPHDLSKNPDPKEYIRCRCHIEYTNQYPVEDEKEQTKVENIAQTKINNAKSNDTTTFENRVKNIVNNMPQIGSAISNFANDNRGQVNFSELRKSLKRNKKHSDNPLWDNLIQTYKNTKKAGDIFPHEFGGKIYTIECVGEYEYNVLASIDRGNIHDNRRKTRKRN